MSFRDTLRQGALADLDFVNDRFETSVRANYDASDNLTLAALAVERKATETGFDLNPSAEATIKFANLFKSQFRQLSADKRQEIIAAFADLYPEGTGSPEIEALFNALVVFQATAGDLVDVGNELLATPPPPTPGEE